MKLFCLSFLLLSFQHVRTQQYLSDEDESYKCIETIQYALKSENHFLQKVLGGVFTKENAKSFYFDQVAHKDSPVVRNVFSFEKDTGDVKKGLEEAFQLAFPGLYPTKYQDPLTYSIYAMAIHEIDKVAKQLYPKKAYTPKFGTLYYNDINAERWPCEKGPYLLLINSKFPVFCHQMGKVVLQPFFVKEDKDNTALISIPMDTATIMKEIGGNKEVGINLLYSYFEFKYKNFPINTELFLNDNYFEKALQYWNSSSETFVIGHEYAHQLLQHTIPFKGDSDEYYLKSWYNEIEADATSQAILNSLELGRFKNEFYLGWNKYFLSGGVFYLNTLDFYEKANSIFDYGVERTEPSSTERALMLEILAHPEAFQKNLQKFKTLDLKTRRVSHPPTGIRKALIEKKLSGLINRQLHKRSEIDQVEDFHYELGQKMNYTLKRVFETSTFAFHNAFKVKDILDEKYKR